MSLRRGKVNLMSVLTTEMLCLAGIILFRSEDNIVSAVYGFPSVKLGFSSSLVTTKWNFHIQLPVGIPLQRAFEARLQRIVCGDCVGIIDGQAGARRGQVGTGNHRTHAPQHVLVMIIDVALAVFRRLDRF
jgi:hypothetical protein